MTGSGTDGPLPSSIFRQAVESSIDGVIITDALRADRPIVYVNPAFERLTGYRAAEVLGKNCRILQGDDREQPERARLRRAVADELPCTVVLRNYRKDGSLFWNELSIAPFRDETGAVTHYIGVQRDVTARVRLERALQEHQDSLEQANETVSRYATHDSVAKVANRRFFLEVLGREWKRAARESTSTAVLLIDVDGYKSFNDRYGYESGDETLARIAAALEGVLKRPADLLARYGGDEFAALLPSTDAAGATQVAEAMREAIRKLAIAHDRARHGCLTVSVGVATCVPGQFPSPAQFLSRADQERLRALEAGGDGLAVFDGQLDIQQGTVAAG